jgi:hypothetical protein
MCGVLSACADTSKNNDLFTSPHFWQRTDTVSAMYLRGAKAQQKLNSDIAHCVTDVREINTSSAVRRAMPADGGQPKGSSKEALAQWETPLRDGMLRAEHTEYHDFETCMYSKGWERVEHVPQDVSEESRIVYSEVILGKQFVTDGDGSSDLELESANSDYENLNE